MAIRLAPFNKLGLILSYACNSQCRHCLYACSGKRDIWLTLEDAAAVMRAIKGFYKDPWGFHIGGGEPFLNFPRLLEVAETACAFKIPFTNVETNAGWCSDERSAKKKLALLRKAGIRSILISSSPFHAEFVPQIRVQLLQKAARDIFEVQRVILFTEDFFNQIAKIELGKTVRIERYQEQFGRDAAVRGFNAIADSYGLTFGGRAPYAIQTTAIEKKPAGYFKGQNCNNELFEASELHIDPYCNSIPSFCSGISLGDARELQTWFECFEVSRYPLIHTLAKEGPYGLCMFAQKEYGYQMLHDGYYDKCHLCIDIRKNIFLQTQQFKELAPKDFYDELFNLTDRKSRAIPCA